MSIIDILKLNEKDPRWLELETCREFQRQRCPRAESECKFAHAPAHVTALEGRVTACYDSIRGRCHRQQPACKYFHPPPHLAQQLLVNGRKYLELKNLILGQVMAAAQQQQIQQQQIQQQQQQQQHQQHQQQQQQQVNYMGGYVPYVMPRPVVPVTMANLGVPPPYMYPPATILAGSKSPQVSPLPACDTIPYPGMFLYKKSVEYKPALYAPTLYAAPGLITPSAIPGLGMEIGQVSNKIAKGLYGQRLKKY